MKLLIPDGYKPILSIHDTQAAIKYIRDSVHDTLENTFNLVRISAALFVSPTSGENDNLSGIERPVSFHVPSINKHLEIVHSLAKWKRVALERYGFEPGQGLYTEMNAIRRDEELDNIHSIYVDQWDWERIITKEERSLETLVNDARQIFDTLKIIEKDIANTFGEVKQYLPDELKILSAQELYDAYPGLSEKEREDAICRKHGAVFLTQIGDELRCGERHGTRAPDYDDWTMNGDLLFYYPVLDCALEISSMGIRVDADTLLSQLAKSSSEEKLELDYHRAVCENRLPYTIGGGLGQSRICMFLLDKAHIGEVQASIWHEETVLACEQAGIPLL